MTPFTIAPPQPPRRPLVGRRRAAIFDLDRTLLPGSSLVHLGRALVRDGVLRSSTLASFAGREVLFRRRGMSESGADRLRERLLALVAGVDQAPLAAVVETVGADLADLIPPAARRLVSQHLELGDYCVVLSSSPRSWWNWSLVTSACSGEWAPAPK